MSKVIASELRYLLFPADAPGVAWNREYQETYRLWRKVWAATFQELDGNSAVYSDDFCRQSRVGAIFLRDRCVALGLYHFVDFGVATARDDSYFKVWSDEAIAKLVTEGPRILVGSNITVDPEMRGDLGGGIFLKNLLTGLMTKGFLDSGYDAMAGTMRKNRGMHQSAYQFGASPLQSGVMHHGVEVDLVAFYRRKILAAMSTLPVDLTVERLWENREEFSTESKKREPMTDLRTQAALETEKMAQVLRDFPWENKEAYAWWLAQTYHMVHHSTRLVALSAAHVPLERAELHTRFIDHAHEERNHQLLCVADLKALGAPSPDQFQCLAATAAIHQIQYYWIQHRGPTTLFGYILVLECMAKEFGPELTRRIVAAFGKEAARFLKVHAEDDVEHTEKAFAQLAQLPAAEQALIQENLAISAELYRLMLKEIIATAAKSTTVQGESGKMSARKGRSAA